MDGRNPFNGRPIRFNLTAARMLTSFGHTIDLNLFLRQGNGNLLAILHWYENGERVFPGLEVELIDHSVSVGGRQLALSPRAALWLQPENQLFASRGGDPGGLVGARVRYPTSTRFGMFVDVEGKTDGWVVGNAYLGASVAMRVGASMRLQ